jgi:hypothetical protein
MKSVGYSPNWIQVANEHLLMMLRSAPSRRGYLNTNPPSFSRSRGTSDVEDLGRFPVRQAGGFDLLTNLWRGALVLMVSTMQLVQYYA